MARRIKNKVKFSNVDILKFMKQIVQKHTKCYQSDFEIDKKILREVVGKQDEFFIWLCHTPEGGIQTLTY